ncbi:MAG: hypothetical protein RSA91_01890 [Bacilli bacterium]
MLVYFNILIIASIILFSFFGLCFYLRIKKMEKELTEEIKEEIAIIEKEKQLKIDEEEDVIKKYGAFEEHQEVHKDDLENEEFEEVHK